MGSGDDEYLAREARARKEIDRQLAAAGWVVQSQKGLNLRAGRGVAVREFILEKPHGRVDYLLFVDDRPVGVIEAKPEGKTLTEVEHQSGKYIFWLRDESLEDSENLPAPEVIAAEIVEDLQAALDQFAAIAASLGGASAQAELVPGRGCTAPRVLPPGDGGP